VAQEKALPEDRHAVAARPAGGGQVSALRDGKNIERSMVDL